MRFSKLSNIFLPSEPDLQKDPIYNVLEGLNPNLTSKATLVIKTNLATKDPYPYHTSIKFLKFFIAELRSFFSGRIVILDAGNFNIEIAGKFNELIEDFKGLNVEFVDAEKDEQIFIKNSDNKYYVYDGFFLPKTWVNADYRIILPNVRINKHHEETAYYGIYHNLVNLLSREMYSSGSKKHTRSKVLHHGESEEMYDFMNTIKALPQTLTIADSRNIGLTDTHSMYLYAKEFDTMVSGEDIYKLEMDFCNKLGVNSMPFYLKHQMEMEKFRAEHQKPVAQEDKFIVE